jgi:hypothetical protein
MNWDFCVKLYSGPRHQETVIGTLVYVVNLRGESTASMEIDVSKRRLSRGELSKIELIDLRPGHPLTNLDVKADTVIPWYWNK